MRDLLEQYVPPVFRFALALTGGDRHAADDLTQETMLRAWRHRERLHDQGSARQWLFRIAANRWRDELRRSRVRRHGLRQISRGTMVEGAPPASMERREDVERALRTMYELPARQREVLHLCVCEGLSISEAAEVLGIGTGPVKSSLYAGRQSLRERLGRTPPSCLTPTSPDA